MHVCVPMRPGASSLIHFHTFSKYVTDQVQRHQQQQKLSIAAIVTPQQHDSTSHATPPNFPLALRRCQPRKVTTRKCA